MYMKTIHNADRLDSLIQKSSLSINNSTNPEQCYSLRISAFACLQEVSVCSFIKASTNQVYAMTSTNINRHIYLSFILSSISLNNWLRPRASPTLERPLILIHCSQQFHFKLVFNLQNVNSKKYEHFHFSAKMHVIVSKRKRIGYFKSDFKILMLRVYQYRMLLHNICHSELVWYTSKIVTCSENLCEVSNCLVVLIFKSRHQSRQTKRNLALGITNLKDRTSQE